MKLFSKSKSNIASKGSTINKPEQTWSDVPISDFDANAEIETDADTTPDSKEYMRTELPKNSAKHAVKRGGRAASGSNGQRTEAERLRAIEVAAKIAAYQKKKIRRRLGLLGVVLAFAVTGVLMVKGQIKPPSQVISFETPSTATPPVSSPVLNEDGTIDETAPSDAPNVPLGRKRDFYTFVIVGEDQGTGNTDTIIVGAYDDANSKLTLVNIPRDTMINVSWQTKKASTMYYLGGKDRVTNLRTQIKNLTGFNPDSYFVVSLDAFVSLVDAIDGVDFDVPISMDYDDPSQSLSIHVAKGQQHLTGSTAVKVARFRRGNKASGGYPDADIGRIHTQQALMKAIAAKTLKLSNIPKIKTFADIFEKNVTTDMTVGNIAWYADKLMHLDTETDIAFMTVPANTNDSVKGMSYCTIYLDKWLEMLNTNLNPFDRELTASDLNILTRKGDKGEIYATSGKIAGGADSFYTNPSTVTAKPVASPTPTIDPLDDPLSVIPPVETVAPTPDASGGGLFFTSTPQPPDEPSPITPDGGQTVAPNPTTAPTPPPTGTFAPTPAVTLSPTASPAPITDDGGPLI